MSNAIEALNAGGKRVRVHDAQMVFKLPKRAKELVAEVASSTGTSEGAILRAALGEYLERRGYRK